MLQAQETRAALLANGVRIASVEGLEGLTIGRLASDLGMSKSGVLGRFGSKEALQLAVIDEAAAVFSREVAARARGITPGLPHLVVVCEAWISYLERDVFSGGCFFMAAAAEFDDRDGPVRDVLAALSSVWQNDLRRQALLAVDAGDLPGDTDVDQLVFELGGLMFALNHALRMTRDHTAGARARRAVNRLLSP